ncbi:MAG: DUF5995 family protein [Candidatus Saccharimonas sp.]
MVKNSTGLIQIAHIASAPDVLNELQRLDRELVTRGLKQFSLFNHAYVIVTMRIADAMRADYFKEPSLIEPFIVIFVRYYFEALNDVVNDTLNPSSPWLKMNEYAKIHSAPVFMSLLIGANAHINHDLPIALKEFVDTRGDDHSLTDLAKLSKILMRSGIEITDSFDEPNKFYDFLKRRLRFTYYRPAMYTILAWRLVAWRNYRRLQSSEAAISHISRRSLKIAKRLLHIARILS